MNVTFETKHGNKSGKDEWLTPPYIINLFDPFDLDPCSPEKRPWDTAKNHYFENGLMLPWAGKVWCNPPYGDELGFWMDKCALHNNAICLVFARTETEAWFNTIWSKADALFFIKGRLSFYHVDGTKGGTAGAPSVFVAYGKENALILKNISIKGKFIQLK